MTYHFDRIKKGVLMGQSVKVEANSLSTARRRARKLNLRLNPEDKYNTILKLNINEEQNGDNLEFPAFVQPNHLI